MQRVEVAAAVIMDTDRKRVLVSQRHPDSHQGGKWEFPGGKCEPGEAFEQALLRELHEELAITPLQYRPFLKFTYSYPEKTIVFSVWTVDQFTGTPRGTEGQPLQWMEINALNPHLFPSANRIIIQALALPERCLISPDAGPAGDDAFLDGIGSALQRGIRLVQLRSHDLDRERYLALAGAAAELCKSHQAQLLLNMPPEWWMDNMAAGLHLPAWRLKELKHRPDIKGWVSAACHDDKELERAQELGVDFVFVSPVKPTVSHRLGKPLGWQGLERILSSAGVPVYALGGMQPEDLQLAKYLGAYGIAGISAFWN
ncbi:MAG TPA: Nudix family hydrolase [Gammaproteobacteria bacterium]